MQCPNNCGELVEIQKPCFVPPTDDVMGFIGDEEHEDLQIYQEIHRVCPKCGFYEATTLSQKQFEEKRETK